MWSFPKMEGSLDSVVSEILTYKQTKTYFSVVLRTMSVCPSEAQDLDNQWTDWALLFREYTNWSCGGFRIFSWGVRQPQPPPQKKKWTPPPL